jgi:hypothetical protein
VNTRLLQRKFEHPQMTLLISLKLGRPKQYKDKFKVWGWQKNLPVDVAHFIIKKTGDRKRANPSKDTAFNFGGKPWTIDRARVTAKRARRENPTEIGQIGITLHIERTLTQYSSQNTRGRLI